MIREKVERNLGPHKNEPVDQKRDLTIWNNNNYDEYLKSVEKKKIEKNTHYQNIQ